MQKLVQDIGFAFRLLLKQRGMTAVALLAIALGIGPTTVIFSAIDGLLLRPFPFDRQERMVIVRELFPSASGSGRQPASYPHFVAWRERNRSFEAMTAFQMRDLNLTVGDRSERVKCILATRDFFAVLGLGPDQGRSFSADEDRPGGAKVAVLSHSLWQHKLGADPAILGRSLILDGESRIVIGVLPEQAQYENAEIWIPLALDAASTPRDDHSYPVLARLKPGIRLAQARAEMSALAAGLTKDDPSLPSDLGASVLPLRDWLLADVRPALMILAGAVILVLLIACVNVANLLLSRSEARRVEIALRAALGATRGRIFRQILTESVILSLLGGGLGLLAAFWANRLLTAMVPFQLPGYFRIEVDGTVLLFTLGITCLAGVLFGLAPALQISRPDLVHELQSEAGHSGVSRERRRLRSAFVISEVALALLLLISASLLITSFQRLQRSDPGFSPPHLLTFQLTLPEAKYPDEQRAAAFFEQLLRKLDAMPGARASAAVQSLPLGGRGSNFSEVEIEIEGSSAKRGELPVGLVQTITPGYFNTLGIPLQSGRAFTANDTSNTPGATVLSRALAADLWPGVNPLGKRLRVIDGSFVGPWLSVVGVAGNVKHRALSRDDGLALYLPLRQRPLRIMSVAVRTAVDPTGFVDAAADAVRSLDPDIPLYRVATMEQVLADSLYITRTAASLLGVFGVVALVLAAVGIFGLLSYSVDQRTQEIGVRLALGANGSDILKLVFGQGMRLVLVGLAIGLVLALGLTRFMRSLLFGVSTSDPFVFAAATLLLVAVALIALGLPARRAARVEPVIAMRR